MYYLVVLGCPQSRWVNRTEFFLEPLGKDLIPCFFSFLRAADIFASEARDKPRPLPFFPVLLPPFWLFLLWHPHLCPDSLMRTWGLHWGFPTLLTSKVFNPTCKLILSASKETGPPKGSQPGNQRRHFLVHHIPYHCSIMNDVIRFFSAKWLEEKWEVV